MKQLLFSYCLLFSFAAFSQKAIKNPSLTNLFDASDSTGIACYRIPALITAKNGDLLAAIDERVPSCGDLKWSQDINVVMRRSTDNGQTWLSVERLVDYPLGQSASDPSFILDEVTGELFLFYNYMDLENAPDVYELHVLSSRDHGQSWSEPQDITAQISKASWRNDFKFITSGRGTQTRSGTLLHTLVNLDHGLHLFKSDDHGRSWSLIDGAITPANESKVIELNDGTWMVNSRISAGKNRFVHRSKDQGKTWSSAPAPSLVDPSCNASIVRYPIKNGSDLLLFVNTNDPNDRKHLTIRYSEDEGQNWSQGKTIYPGSAAYASMTILANGEIGVFYEQDNYRKNIFARFTLAWLMTKD
jgi:sialidase-1